MKINEITESITSSASIAPVSTALGGTRSRSDDQGVYSGGKVGTLLKGKQTSKKFANSLSENDKPKIRKYTDSRDKVWYEVLDSKGQRARGQGTSGFSDKQSAKEFLEKHKVDLSELSEVAASVAQQKLFGMAHAIQKGKKVPGASKELKQIAKTVSPKAVTDFAKTKHKGLPKHVAEADLQEDDVIIQPSKDRYTRGLMSKDEVAAAAASRITIDKQLLNMLMQYVRNTESVDLSAIAKRIEALCKSKKVLSQRDYPAIVDEGVMATIGGLAGGMAGAELGGAIGSAIAHDIGKKAGQNIDDVFAENRVRRRK